MNELIGDDYHNIFKDVKKKMEILKEIYDMMLPRLSEVEA